MDEEISLECSTAAGTPIDLKNLNELNQFSNFDQSEDLRLSFSQPIFKKQSKSALTKTKKHSFIIKNDPFSGELNLKVNQS